MFFYGNENDSLAKRLYLARNIDFNESMGSGNIVADYWHDQIFDYYHTHGLTFGLRGFDNMDVIIGKNTGDGELSYCDEGKEVFRYNFSLNDFYKVVEETYSKNFY